LRPIHPIIILPCLKPPIVVGRRRASRTALLESVGRGSFAPVPDRAAPLQLEEGAMAFKKAKSTSTNSKKTPATSRKTTRAHTDAPMIIRDTPMIVRHHPAPSCDDIAKRAYQIFERRGYSHGHDEEDWFQAERELRQGL
jgi:hypothetical protein